MPYSARDRILPDWLTKIRTRQTVLPRFQRHEAWDHKRVTSMLNTILDGLPVGAALVLSVGNEEPFVSRPIATAPSDGERVTEHLLDGQQRITGLWRALAQNNYRDRTFYLVRRAEDGNEGHYRVLSIKNYHKNGEKYPLWANDPKKLWRRRHIPIDLVAPTEDDRSKLRGLREWVKSAIEDRDFGERIFDELIGVRDQFRSFNLPYLLLPLGTPPATAVDVFVKMNTSFAKLSTYHIVVALIEAGLGESLHDYVRDRRSECPSIIRYQTDAQSGFERFVLNANALMQNRVPNEASFMHRDFGRGLLANVDIFKSGLRRTVDFLEQERVFDYRRLPSSIVVPVLVALWSHTPEGLDIEGRARSVLRRYIWRAFFTNRYEVATAGRQLEDFNQVKALILDPGSNQPRVFSDDEYPLPNKEDLLRASWPRSANRLARAILALSLRNGGIDLADGSQASHSNLTSREYHHIFPDGHLKDRDDSEVVASYRALNCALISWKTNRNISAKDPRTYLEERLAGTHLTETELRDRLASHFIPYDLMYEGNYERFLEARAELIHEEMTRLCNGAQN